MGFLAELRSRCRVLIGPLIGICSIAYFGFHAVHGDRGLMTYWRLKQGIAETRPILEEARAERAKLERRVRLLRPESLDPDMLEERARYMLNLGRPGDIVILLDKEKTP